jgi:hypothetical protein
MKRIGTKLALRRETLKRLEDASLSHAAGGIFTLQPGQTVPCSGTCTFTCAGCLGE